jgi:hypothetical protein
VQIMLNRASGIPGREPGFIIAFWRAEAAESRKAIVASLVVNFQKDVLDSRKSVTDILRTAKVISAKLSLNDIEEWIAAELNGYPDIESTPSYRRAEGTLQVENPYRGWIVVTGESIPTIPMPFGYSIPQIEEFSKQETVYIAPQTKIPLSPPAYASLPQRVLFFGNCF